MKNTRLIAVIAAVAVLVLGGTGYILRDQLAAMFSGGTPAAVQTADTSGATQGGAVVDSTPAAEVVQPAKPRDPYVAPKAIDFAFRRLEIDTSKDQPEACLVFTRDLVADGSVRYEDYLAFDPQTQIAVRPTADRLCVAGLVFNQDYTLTMRQGLPAAGGEKLINDETIPVALRDRPSSIAFSNGFILPRDSAEGVPVTTVNVDTLKISIVRVGDRLLSQLRDYVLDQREYYSYDEDSLKNEQGAVAWTGEMSIANLKNQAVTTTFAIGDALPAMKPGTYLILAEDKAKHNDPDAYSGKAGQWIINTDIALTSYKGYDGLTVFVRSFANGQPTQGVKLQLVAQNNDVLGEATTNSDGKAEFAGALLRGEGGNAPAVVMAYNDRSNDFAYLDLRRAAFDLSDRGVDGRAAAGDLDAFLYLDRGIYRPGETVQLNALIRDRDARAIANAPVTIIVTRPDGEEFRRFLVRELRSGAAFQPITLSASAPRGRWTASVYTDPEGDALGRIEFDVQDFVPQKLKVTLESPVAIADVNNALTVKVESRFLYGAPAAGLGGEGVLKLERASVPFAQYKDFEFGLTDERFDPVTSALSVGTTDAEGKTEATGAFDGVDPTQTTVPLQATVTVNIYEPGGRTTGEEIVIPVKTRSVLLGIRSNFDYGTVPENAEANFEAVAVNEKGEPVLVTGATYEFVKEIVDYRWYRDNDSGDWRYERIVHDRILSGGTTDISAQALAKLTQRVDWGSYRLTIADPATGARTSVRFYAGWGASSGDRPDRLSVSNDKQTYKAGETAQVTVRSPVEGSALLVIAGDKVYESRVVAIQAGETKVPVTVNKEWGAGVYALVTLYRPLAAASKGGARAIGLAYLGIDAADRTLAVTLNTPEKMLPRQTLDVPVEVAGAEGDVFVTVAAIDEGVLQLTDFVTPDPVKYFFGKRRLGVDIRDDYGRLIETTRYQVGELRTGGDGFGGRGLAVVPQRVVALYAGPVKLEGGKGSVKLDVPDFNGELRVMAVAWSQNAVGFGSKPVTVRDPVVAEIVLPRFLAPGDKASAALNIHNVDGAPGEYKASISASDPVSVPAESQSVVRTLAAGERQLVPVTLTSTGAGIATVRLAIEGPNGFKVERVWPIEVRSPQLPTSVDQVALMQPGESYAVPAALTAGYTPGSSTVSITLSGGRGFDNVAGMMKWLDRYPYGCLEQTTSRALPLVYLEDLAKLAGLEEKSPVRQRVQDAIDRVLDMQRPDGGFGMWSSGYDDDADRFLQVYAMDFLIQAKAKGFVVPQEAINRAMRYARQVGSSDSSGKSARAYAFYVMAKAGQGQPSDLRYFADNDGASADDALGAGFLGAALSLTGDRSRAAKSFSNARFLALETQPINYRPDYYGSMLRDVAGLTSVAAEAGETNLVAPLIDMVNTFDTSLNYTTTQEKSWMLVAQWRLLANAPPVKVEAAGTEAREASGQTLLRPTAAELASGVSLRNAGDKPIWRTVSVTGDPSAPLPAAASGVTITKQYFNLDGTPANLATLKQNDQVVVVISGEMGDKTRREMAVIDLLPAGFEIEGMITINENGGTIYPWLSDLTRVSIQEARDDRYVAAFALGYSYRGSPEEEARRSIPVYRVAYVARATVAGSFANPAAAIEDMYAPKVKGRTAMGSVVIAAQ